MYPWQRQIDRLNVIGTTWRLTPGAVMRRSVIAVVTDSALARTLLVTLDVRLVGLVAYACYVNGASQVTPIGHATASGPARWMPPATSARTCGSSRSLGCATAGP